MNKEIRKSVWVEEMCVEKRDGYGWRRWLWKNEMHV